MKQEEKRIIELFELPIRYEGASGYIFDNKERMMADIRAWGYLQYKENGELLQDTLGEMFADAFNEKYSNP